MTLGKLVGGLAIFIMVAIVGVKQAQAGPIEDAYEFCIDYAELHRKIAELRDLGIPPENVMSQLIALDVKDKVARDMVYNIYVVGADISPTDMYVRVGKLCTKTLVEGLS